MTNKILTTAAAAILGLTALTGGGMTAAAGTASREKIPFDTLSASRVVVKPGEKITIRAQVLYRDQKGDYQPLRDQTVPVEMWLQDRQISASHTDSDGWATVTIPVGSSVKPGRAIWRVVFRGEPGLMASSQGGYFNVAR